LLSLFGFCSIGLDGPRPETADIGTRALGFVILSPLGRISAISEEGDISFFVVRIADENSFFFA
jgi:hypothetical protein